MRLLIAKGILWQLMLAQHMFIYIFLPAFLDEAVVGKLLLLLMAVNTKYYSTCKYNQVIPFLLLRRQAWMQVV